MSVSVLTIKEKYIERMLAIAQTVSGWSTCPMGRRHGCVLAVEGKYVVATGYNGTAVGEQPCLCGEKASCPSTCEAIHAEVNALVNAARVGVRVDRCVAYVTKQPCRVCRGTLKNAGVWRVYWTEGPFPNYEDLNCEDLRA